jgi:biopolymer transport protein ExbB
MVGLLDSFTNLSAAQGIASTSEVARGLYQSLVTAALGIVVAVPSYLAYAFLTAKVRSIMHELERAGIEIVNLIVDARNNDNIVEFPKDSELGPVRLELTSRSRSGKK